MSEAFQPSTEDVEAAVAAALARPNPYDEAHAKALEAEQLLNELLPEFDDDEDSDAAQEFINDTVQELDEECGHLFEDIVINGLVKVRQLNHKLVDADGGIPNSAIEDSWEPVDDFVATSLGYFAIRDGRGGKEISVYHGARTQRERIAFDMDHGEIFKSGRIFIPVDGSAQALPAFQKREIDHELMRHYIDEELMGDIDEAMMNYKNFSEAIINLGKIDLKRCRAIELDEKLRFSLIDYVNETLGIMRDVPYEISGGSFIEYHDEEANVDKVVPAPKESVVGNIIGIGIEKEVGRFRLVATMPFNDGTPRDMIYRINSKLTVKRLRAFTLEATTKLRVT